MKKYENLEFENPWCPKCGITMDIKDKTDSWMLRSGGGSIYIAKIVYNCRECDITAEIVWTWTPKKEEELEEPVFKKYHRKKTVTS
ncbi:MAG: hypothetical protein ACUVXA_10480 [Candidatus Jordarchaeum sp.]|uniref:hypothetical protein n=1 Tax=Candidatus Jordarchaeum sp. TaxID=2823881 RepID=UPI00404AE714